MTDGRLKPTNGYPSRTSAIKAMLREGKTPTEIARLLKVDRGSVYVLAGNTVRETKHLRPRSTYFKLPPEQMAALIPHAARRDISPRKLIHRLLTVIIEDNLIDNVLDDLEE